MVCTRCWASGSAPHGFRGHRKIGVAGVRGSRPGDAQLVGALVELEARVAPLLGNHKIGDGADRDEEFVAVAWRVLELRAPGVLFLLGAVVEPVYRYGTEHQIFGRSILRVLIAAAAAHFKVEVEVLRDVMIGAILRAPPLVERDEVPKRTVLRG